MATLAGKATARGTSALRERFEKLGLKGENYSLLGDLRVSCLGLGTYLGDEDEETSTRMREALRLALRSGFNLVDTSINYRGQLSERLVGRVLAELNFRREFNREEVVVCTKGGFLPLDAEADAPADAYLRRTYLDSLLVPPEELAAGIHCLAPTFLQDQLRRSLRNLGLEAVDFYYLHNPEIQLSEVPRDEFRRRLSRAFEWLEEKVKEGLVGNYGLATWNGLRLDQGDRDYLDLQETMALAREVGGAGHHFKVVQAPFNLVMPQAFRKRNQRALGPALLTLAEACQGLGLSLTASSPLNQGRLARNLDPAFFQGIPLFGEDSQKAIHFARSGPGLAAVLVGMNRREQVSLNLALMKAGPMSAEDFDRVLAAA